jgi:aminopeptidase
VIPPDDLRAYARLICEVGLALEAGQRLAVQGISGGVALEAAPLVRAVAEAAYACGASHVGVSYADDAIQVVRLRRRPADAVAELVPWEVGVFNELVEGEDADLAIDSAGPDYGPDLADRSAVAERALVEATEAMGAMIDRMGVNWCIGGFPGPSWAARVLGDVPDATDRLWAAMRTTLRLDRPDPVAAWREHLAALAARRVELDALRLDALRVRGPGTDLRIGLAAAHRWEGGATARPDGHVFVPNLPIEEVYTAPDRRRVDGTVRLTRAVRIRGQLVRDGWLEFRDGAVTAAGAAEGEASLQALLDADATARHLGEVALVGDSPVARIPFEFQHVLFDENAACHIALGSTLRTCLRDVDGRDEAAVLAAGGNVSPEHHDVMFGGPGVDVDGVRADGSVVPLVRGTAWAGT